MVFWTVLAIVLVVVLAAAWRADRKRRGTRVNAGHPDASRRYTEARAESERRHGADWNQMG